MAKSKTQPEIRFAGFTDAWEQRKLGGLTDFSKGSGYSKGDLCGAGTPIILYGRLYTKFETVISEVDTFVSERENSVFSKGGEVIVPASGETAEDISRASVVENAGIILGGDLNVLKPKPEIDPAFLAITISNGTQQKELSKRAQGKSVVHLHNSDLQEVILVYPKLDEQRKIGAFFSALDRLITLHQRECDKTVNSKKAMLEKMFPKDGEDKPEIRFAGFTDAWEQRRLGEVAPLRGGFAFQSARFREVGVPIIRISNVLSNGKVGGIFAYYDEQADDSNYTLPDKSALLAMSGATTGKVSILENLCNRKVYQNQRVGYFVDEGVTDYSFISTIVKSNLFLNKLNPALVAGAQPNISSKDVDSFEFYFPTAREEQQEIGAFFFALDRLIALHQRELAKLQNMKKALLEKMFV